MKMKRNTRWLLAATTVLALAALGWAFMPKPIAVEAASVVSGPFEAAIEEEGRTRIRDSFSVSAPLAGRLARITLREGDVVAAGQVLALLSPQLPSLQDARTVAEARARLLAAEAGVALAQARLDRSGVAVAQARHKLTRSEGLAQQGFVSHAALDDDRLAVDAAQRERDAAASQREVARQERAQAAAALQQPGAAGGKPGAVTLALRAPVDGVVLKVPQPSEASGAAGAVVMTLGDPRQMEILVQLLTTDALQARPGGAAVIEGWGGPPLPARVLRVEPAAFTKVSALGVEEQRVNVLLEVTPTPQAWQRMGDGFRVLVRVVTTSADGVLLVPIGALFPRPEGGMAVYRLDGGHARLQPVELGGRNSRVGWVTSGLSAGQRVVVYPPAGVTDGGRVTERKP
jgi:HlyD family secretion protein